MLLLVSFSAIVSSVSSMTELYEETSTISSAGSDGSSCIGAKDSTMTTDALNKLSGDYLGSCLALLGKDRLQEQQAMDIWNRLLEVNGGAPEYVPEYLIRHLGWIAIGIPASHMLNLTMTDVDTVSALGAFRNLSESQLSALAQAFREQWPSKEPEDWTDIDLVMFGHILCGFNESDILRMHADAYKMAALKGTGSLANLRGCNNDSIEALAKLAVRSDAFGDPHFWEASQVRAVGCVLSGLPVDSLTMIPANAMAGLSSASVRCLSPRVMSALTSDQLSTLSSGAQAGAGASEAKYGQQKGSHVRQMRPFEGYDEDDKPKNKAYRTVSIVSGFMTIFWAPFLWSATFEQPKLALFR